MKPDILEVIVDSDEFIERIYEAKEALADYKKHIGVINEIINSLRNAGGPWHDLDNAVCALEVIAEKTGYKVGFADGANFIINQVLGRCSA